MSFLTVLMEKSAGKGTIQQFSELHTDGINTLF